MSVARGHFKAGWDSVRGAKWRNFWTILGVIIGVASVISVVSIGEGVKQQISGQIHHLGKDLITIRPSQIDTSSGNGNKDLHVLSGISITGSLSKDDVKSVRQTVDVSASAPFSALTGSIKGDGSSYNSLVVGTTSDLPSLLNQSLAYGAFFSDDDADSNVVILGQKAAERLFSEAVPLGRTVSFHGQDFIVDGIFNEFPTSSLASDADYNNAIFIPYATAQNLSNDSSPTYEILAKATTSSKTASVAAALNQRLLKNHGGQADFSVLQQNQNVASSSEILELLTRLITGVAAISLLVSGIGIMNVMLVSVTERLHEIGIRKAIGATNRQILSQFLVEATVLSLAGGAIGIIVSYIIDGALRLTTSLQPDITWQIVAIAAGVSLLVGMIFGSIPALKAARKDPIDALRAE